MSDVQVIYKNVVSQRSGGRLVSQSSDAHTSQREAHFLVRAAGMPVHALYGKHCEASAFLLSESTTNQGNDPHRDSHLQTDSPLGSGKVIPRDLSGVFL